MNGRFKIFLRHRQNTFEGNDVLVQCNPATGFAEYVPGTVDNTWRDYTDYIDNAEKLSLNWDSVNSGNNKAQTNPDGSNYDKGVSSDLVFFDLAYDFIKEWLMTTECQILNSIEVKIVDLIAGGTYRLFEIKNDNIEFAPVDEPCRLTIKLREQDEIWHCVHKTTIWDNHQHWFEASGVKEHPCFLTCIEPRPRLLQSARMALTILYRSAPVAIFIPGDFTEEIRRILNADRFVDSPLVRTYIKNVAMKCGLLTDTIFDEGQAWENLCVFHPSAGYMHESSDDSMVSPALFYHYDNRWFITLADFLDKLKPVFAAEWYVTPNNTIVFKHEKDLISLAPIYDFTIPGNAEIFELRYSFNGDKKAAYGRYEYTPDGSDLASQEMSTLYNDIVDYDGDYNNPMLEGERTKNFEFAPTGFIRDGRSKDYLELLIKDGKLGASMLLVFLTVMFVILAPSVAFSAAFAVLGIFAAWEATILARSNTLKNIFVDGDTYTGAVRLTSEQTLAPRLILWDGVSMSRAKAVKRTTMPTPNTIYNRASDSYDTVNDISKDNPDNAIYNYPLYFDGYFLDNMFDKYHEPVDNPLKSKESHQNAKFYVDLCDDMLSVFGVFDNSYIAIGKVVKLETRDNYDVFVRIKNINVDYDSNRINVRGRVLRRA